MSSFLRNRKFLLTLGAIAAGGGYLYYQNRGNCYFNQRWERVGKVSHLYVYPVKSCSFIEVSQVEATHMGAKTDSVSDRVFMVVNENQEFVTARSFPKLVLVKPSVQDKESLILSAPGIKDFTIKLNELSHDKDKDKETKDATIWESKVEVVDLGDEASQWITQVCGTDKGGKLRLVHYPQTKCMRQLRSKHKEYKDMDKKHIGALQDATSFMLLNETSLQDLNTKLDTPVEPTQFRPNIVIADAKAYDEDSWKFIRIGDKAIMKSLKPCTRGTFSAVDQKSGDHSKDGEPLKTLNAYRQKDGHPVMGINAGLFRKGEIKVGDEVYVSYKDDDYTATDQDTKKKQFSSYLLLNDK